MTISRPPLTARELQDWMERALTDEAQAREVEAYLRAHPDLLADLPAGERVGVELAWMGLWRRLSGELPFKFEL